MSDETKVIRFPLKQQAGAAARTFVCECGHADREHNADKFGYPCLTCAPRCWAFRPIVTATDEPALEFGASRKDVAQVAAFLNRVSYEVLHDEHEIRPTQAIVILLNDTGSDLTWCGHLTDAAIQDGHHEMTRSQRNAQDWWHAKHAHDADPTVEMATVEWRTGARQRRLAEARAHERMKAIRCEQLPSVCRCKRRFKNDAGLARHRPHCRFMACPTCDMPSTSASHEHRDSPNGWRTQIETHRCRNAHTWKRERRFNLRRYEQRRVETEAAVARIRAQRARREEKARKREGKARGK